jgi:hypothetical protein
MTSREDFTDEEWERLGRAPLVTGLAISFADPGGPIEAIKESSAALKTVLEAAQGEDDDQFGPFVRAIAADVAAKAKRRENPLAGFKPESRSAREDILDELRAVHALLQDKATPDELADFRDWLRTAAQRAALAAREGGFLGIGSQRVSDREQEMLETVGEIFGVPRSS